MLSVLALARYKRLGFCFFVLWAMVYFRLRKILKLELQMQVTEDLVSRSCTCSGRGELFVWPLYLD